MVTEIILLLSSVLIFTGCFSALSVWGTKILYVEKLKDLYDNKDELIKIIKLRMTNLELEGKEDNDEHRTLNILLNDLIKVK